MPHCFSWFSRQEMYLLAPIDRQEIMSIAYAISCRMNTMISSARNIEKINELEAGPMLGLSGRWRSG